MPELKINKLLQIIQSEVKVPKKNYNKFANFYYRSLADILEVAVPIAHKYECAISFHDDMVMVGGNIYVKSTAILSSYVTNEKEICSAFAREQDQKKGMDAMQLSGATMSYARKYAISGLLCLSDEKDADTDEYKIMTQDNTLVNNDILMYPPSDLPWLNEGTPEWDRAETDIKNGMHPEELRKEYKVSRKHMATLTGLMAQP